MPSNVTKAVYTRPVPPEARILERKGVRFARFKRGTRDVEAPLTADGTRCRIASEEYYVRYKDHEGRWRWEKGYTDLRATRELQRKIDERVAHKQEGLVDPFDEHRKRPLSEHLDDFEAALSAQRSPKHVRLVVDRATKIIDGCGFTRTHEIEAFRVEVFLGELADKGLSAQTRKHYLRAIKQFTRWLQRHRRMADDPLAHLEPPNVETDRRRVRRALSADEVQTLLEHAVRSRVDFRGLSGADRFVVYYLALGTGLRASEIASLSPGSFRCEGDAPIVVVEAGTSKRRHRDEQPLQPDVVAIVQDYLTDKPAGELLWPTLDSQWTARMLKADLEAARAAWIGQGATERENRERQESDFLTYQNAAGEVADFHAQRHTYITQAAKILPPRMAQALARHSCSAVTDRYTHLALSDTSAAAAQLPPLMKPKEPVQAQRMKATGTDDAVAVQRTEPEPPPVASPKEATPKPLETAPRILKYPAAETPTTGRTPCHLLDTDRAQPCKTVQERTLSEATETEADSASQLLMRQAQTVARETDGTGFEPAVDSRPQRFSRPPP